MHSYPRLVSAAAPPAQSPRSTRQTLLLNASVNLFAFCCRAAAISGEWDAGGSAARPGDAL